MNCRQIQRRLSAAMDMEQAPDGAVSEHLARCRECAAFWEASWALDERLRDAGAALRAGQGEVQTLRAQPLRPARGSVMPRLWGTWLERGLAAAALVALAVILLMPDAKVTPTRETGPAVAKLELPALPLWRGPEPLTRIGREGRATLEQEMQGLVQDARQALNLVLAPLPRGWEEKTQG